MRAPIRLVQGGWPSFVEARLARFVRSDPSALATPGVDPDQYRKIISQLHVGDTIKITEANRHPRSDQLLVDHVDTSGKTIVDLGASDGTTSLELIRRLSDFGRYVIADLYLTAKYARTSGHFLVFDSSGTCVLASGSRLVAWPAASPVVRTLYRPLLRRSAAGAFEQRELLLLNPDVVAHLRRDTRVTFRTHDVFTAWEQPPADIIKIANLLRRLYFSDSDIVRALRAVHASLPNGGHLLIVDNPRIEGIRERGGLYRRACSGFELVARTELAPEIDDLITGFVCEEGSESITTRSE